MSKIFGKRKGKKKGTQDFRSYASISQALMPPAVFVAAPRIAGCSYEPIILRPVDPAEYESLPKFQGFSTDLPPPRTDNQEHSADEDEDPADSTFNDEYDVSPHEMPAPHVFATAGVHTPVLRPPNEFDDEDEDSSRMEEVHSQMIRQSSLSPVRHENASLRQSPAASLRASVTMTSQKSQVRMEQPSFAGEELKSQMTQLSMSHSNHSMERQITGDNFDATEPIPHSLEASELQRSLREEYQLSRSASADRHQLSGQILGQHQLSGQQKLSGKHQLSGQHQLSMADYSDLMPDKRDKTVFDQQERIRELENELRNMSKYVDVHKNEIKNLLKMKEEVETPASSQARIGKAREEVETLKTIVHRLNAELDMYQKKFRKLTPSEMDEISSFPIKGPKPSWLVNTKYLSPLLVAYDDRLREKESIIETYENKIAIFQQKVDEILKENNRLHIRLEQTDAVGPISMTEWRQFQEQCKLVLEENQLLMEQLDIQQNKEKDLRKTFLQETSKQAQRASVADTEKAQLQLEVDELRAKFNGLKQKYDEAVIDNRSKMHMEEHIDALSAIKQTAQEDKVRHAKELAEMSAKIQVAEVEKSNLEKELDEAKATIKQLEADITNKLKTEKKYKKEIEFLQMTVNDSEMLSAKVKQYLASVLKTAEVTAKERDTLALSVQEQEKAKLAALKKLIAETADMAKIKDKIKAYNQKKKEKLDKMTNRLKEQDDEFNLQRQEYEREIKHLQQLVRDKDEMVNIIRGEKKVVLEDLETMWQAATKDNQRMQETIRQTNRKLQDHVSLRTRLLDDPEPSTALDQMLKQCGCDDDLRVQ